MHWHFPLIIFLAGLLGAGAADAEELPAPVEVSAARRVVPEDHTLSTVAVEVGPSLLSDPKIPPKNNF